MGEKKKENLPRRSLPIFVFISMHSLRRELHCTMFLLNQLKDKVFSSVMLWDDLEFTPVQRRHSDLMLTLTLVQTISLFFCLSFFAGLAKPIHSS